MKKKIFYVIAAILVIIIAYRLFVFFTKKKEVNNASQTAVEIPVKAVAVKKMEIIENMYYTGDIVGTEVVNVFPQVTGKIRSINATVGQKVNKGQTLFKIDRDIVGMEYMPAVVDSPITGYIGKVMVDKGMTVAPSVPLAQVVNMNDVEAVIYVIEKNINKVQLGMAAEISVEAFKDRIFYGKVYKKSAVVDPMTRTLEVRVLIDNTDVKLKHGMYANVRLIISKKNDAIVIPVDSVILDIDDNTYVMAAVNNTAAKKEVKTGIIYEGYAEVLSGLSVGDIVITLGKENTSEGSKLLVYRDDKNNNTVK